MDPRQEEKQKKKSMIEFELKADGPIGGDFPAGRRRLYKIIRDVPAQQTEVCPRDEELAQSQVTFFLLPGSLGYYLSSPFPSLSPLPLPPPSSPFAST